MKKVAIALGVLVFVGVASQAYAAPEIRYDKSTDTCRVIGDGPLEWESRPWGQGGQIFKSLCQSCHADGDDNAAPFLWKESKTSKGWNRVFANQYPKCAKDGSWSTMSKDQELMVNDFLYRWAKDSQDANDSA
ncbi:MAG: hypothetical protein H8E79_05070 [Desulfobulbaceae bacterium]|uniref:Cytochrome c domain-containing protein n=1 Tax=Candidatus Desulfatifera sulfidica TaxID=2841691 RepID=A0A8J6NBM7_9BACT|nr:hypothetical protein [Candidatus Desulfatifera sulfidica]